MSRYGILVSILAVGVRAGPQELDNICPTILHVIVLIRTPLSAIFRACKSPSFILLFGSTSGYNSVAGFLEKGLNFVCSDYKCDVEN